MTHDRDTWPISAALLQFPSTLEDGTSVQDAPAPAWHDVMSEVADAGFADVDLTDSWLRPGDLSAERLTELTDVARDVGVGLPAISAIRHSVVDPDPQTADDNLAYLHRTIDAAPAIGAGVVSVGLHRPLTAEQQAQLWFWTVDGPSDPVGDRDTWDRAVERLRELGKHAADVGVLLSLELYEDTYLGTGASAVRLVEDIGLDEVGLNPDLGNLVRLHRPVEDWRDLVAMTAPYANYWHVKNYFRDEDPATGQVVTMPAPLELGYVDYRTALRTMLAHGFRGVICCEHYGGDGLSVSARNQEYLRRLLPAPQHRTQPQEETPR